MGTKASTSSSGNRRPLREVQALVWLAFNCSKGCGSLQPTTWKYDSSPVRDRDRTVEPPLDATHKLSAGYGWKLSQQMNFALAGTLLYFGDGQVDETARGIRFTGEFDINMALYLGETTRYVF